MYTVAQLLNLSRIFVYLCRKTTNQNHTDNMSDKSGTLVLPEVLPKKGVLYFEETNHMILCKPRIMPLKSITLEKMEKIQKDAQEAVKQQMVQESEANNSY